MSLKHVARSVLVTGSSGFLGKALVKELTSHCTTLETLHTFRSNEFDLTQAGAAEALLRAKPADTVIHLAAKVGGIAANRRAPGSFCYENLIMGTNLIEQCRLHGVKKFVLIGTICSYPKFTPIPFRESDLWCGYPDETNAPYGLAKKMLMVQLDAYRQQYGMNGISLLMVNLYGPHDNFDPQSSHVIPGMIRRFHEAKESGASSVTLWGDGTPTREFLFINDAAKAVRLATESYNSPAPTNIGFGLEISIAELAHKVKALTGFSGEILWDTSKPNGQPRRLLDVSRAKSEFGFTAKTSLDEGLKVTYQWYLKNFGRSKVEPQFTRPLNTVNA